MKKAVIIFSGLFIACIVFGISSCHKDAIQTPFTRMLGKWKKVKYATDDNGNGVIDSWEIQNVPTELVDDLNFKPDSTGVETTNSNPPAIFRWLTGAGPSVLIQYNANDTVLYAIEEITSGDMTLTTNTNLGLAWYYYVKQ